MVRCHICGRELGLFPKKCKICGRYACYEEGHLDRETGICAICKAKINGV